MASELKIYDDKNILVIDDIPPFNIQDYDIFDDKDFKKYINDCEKIIRTSFEYREFTNYLRNYMNMNKCSFFENVTNLDTFKIKIHIHHCPFTLYELVLTIFNKRSFYHESLEIEMVAKEVMYIHYFLMVGLIPLAETVHELVHSQVIFIPLNKVCGNYEEFVETYSAFIPEDSLDKLERMKRQTEIYNEAANLAVLQQQPLLIEIPHNDGSGTYNIPSMEKIMQLMNNRILEIKEKQQYRIEATDDNIIDEPIKGNPEFDFKYVDGKKVPVSENGMIVPVYFVNI